MVKELQTGRKIEILKDYYIRTMISASESYTILNKRRVFNGTVRHFTKVYEKDAINTHETKELYYKLNEDTELPLNTFRLMASDKRGKQLILDGVLELLLLISDGKVYNVELNPLNFIAEDKPDLNRVYVKAFHREDKGLREITDKWLNDAKKLIGYFLLSDSGYNETNFNSLRPIDYHREMTGTIAEQYMKIIKSTSIDQMARDWFMDNTYKEIKNFPPIVDDYKKPKDITTVGVGALGEFSQNEETRFDDRDMPVNKSDETFWKNHGGSIENEPIDLEEKLRGASTRKKKSGNKKVVAVGIVIILIGVIIWGILGNRTTYETIEVSDNYYKGLLKVATEKYNGASEDFDQIVEEELETLTGDEKDAIYKAYLLSGKYDQALEIDKDSAEEIIEHLMDTEQLEKVEGIHADNAVINYEKAVINKDYPVIIDHRTDVERTPRRHNQIVEAYVMTGEVSLAVDYVISNDLEKMDKKVKKYYKNYKKENEVTDEEDEKAKEHIAKLEEKKEDKE